MKRLYNNVLKNHFEDENKMAFLAGPRQVGKTTTSTSSFFIVIISTGIIRSIKKLYCQGLPLFWPFVKEIESGRIKCQLFLRY